MLGNTSQVLESLSNEEGGSELGERRPKDGNSVKKWFLEDQNVEFSTKAFEL